MCYSLHTCRTNVRHYTGQCLCRQQHVDSDNTVVISIGRGPITATGIVFVLHEVKRRNTFVSALGPDQVKSVFVLPSGQGSLETRDPHDESESDTTAVPDNHQQASKDLSRYCLYIHASHSHLSRPHTHTDLGERRESARLTY